MPESDESFQSRQRSKERDRLFQTYLEQRRGNAPYRVPPKADQAVSRIVRPLAKKFGPGASVLDQHWEKILGPKLAQLCRPDELRSGKVLVVKARGPAASVITAQARTIIQRINNILGPGSVKALKVVQGPVNPPRPGKPAAKPTITHKPGLSPSEETALKNGLTDFKDGPLKNALENLGRAVYRDGKSNRS